MLGCWVHTAFTLEYQGPFSCEPVPYLTAGCAAAVLVALLVAKICYKRKQNWTKIKSAKLQRQINRHMQYRQPQWSDFPIRSWYPGYMGSTRFPQVFYLFSSFIFSDRSTYQHFGCPPPKPVQFSWPSNRLAFFSRVGATSEKSSICPSFY